MIKTNKELSEAVNKAILESGYKKIWIAEQIGISNQNLNSLITKKGFSLDDATKILSIIGYDLQTEIIKKLYKNKVKFIDKQKPKCYNKDTS